VTQELDALIRARIDELGTGVAQTTALHALIELHARAKTESPPSLSLFREALPKTIALLRDPEDHIRMHAFQLIGVMKLDPAQVVPQLVTELGYAHQARWALTYYIADALAAYGRDAAPAIPALLEVLRTADYRYTVQFSAAALAAIAPEALDAVPVVEAARDRVTFQFKSDEKEFKSSVNRIIRSLQRSAKPQQPAVKRNDRQTYLLDLIARMSHQGVGLAADDAIRNKAREEAGQLRDPELLTELASLIQSGLKVAQLVEAMVTLGFLTRNTGSADGRKLIADTLQRPGLSDRVVQAAVYAATDAGAQEAIPSIKRLLREGNSHPLTFVEKLKVVECVPDVVEFMKVRPQSALLGIFALKEIGSAEAVPVLLEYASREFTSRKDQEKEWRFYAFHALGKIGDRSVVPALIDLLARFKGWEAPILGALHDLSDARSADAVINALNHQVRSGSWAERWSDGHRTPIVNGLELLTKIGRLDDPRVVALVASLRDQHWKHLLPEEQAWVQRNILLR
jgi:HEAT repeat protein